jgi:Domain of unknown function (DUF4252)
MPTVRVFAIATLAALSLWGQQFHFNLDHLTGKGNDSVDVSLNRNMLQFAAKFLDGKDAEEAKMKTLIASLEGIYVKRFQFKKEGTWSPGDLEKIRVQLKAPEWSRIVGVQSADRNNIEVYVRTENSKVSGVAILSSGPKELTVANLVGEIDLDSIAELGGRFGVPKVEKKK